MDLDHKRFGARLTYHRRLRGVKQGALAKTCEMGINALTQLETGQRAPRAEEVEGLADAMGLTEAERAELRADAVATVEAMARDERGFGPGEAP